ncbi:MAG: hypothetical protein ACT4OZ_03380 [Gemmatimonadota bacterium]
MRTAVMITSALVLGLGASETAAAQVSRISAAAMAAALTKSDESDSRGGLFTASADQNALFILNRRTGASAIELHCAWDDVLFVRSGAGVMHHGRKLRGLKRYGYSEWRATEIVTPTEVNISAGDVIRVPAGEAHTILPLGDAPLVYLVVKMRSFEERACGSLPERGK